MASQMLLIFNPAETVIPPGAKSLPIPTHGAKGAGHVCFAAKTGEVERWREHLESHGVAIEADITWPNSAASIYVRDPANNSMEFAESRLWALE